MHTQSGSILETAGAHSEPNNLPPFKLCVHTEILTSSVMVRTISLGWQGAPAEPQLQPCCFLHRFNSQTRRLHDICDASTSQLSLTSLLELMAQLLLLLAVPWLMDVFKLPPGGCVELNIAAEPLPDGPAAGDGPWGAMAPLLGDLPSMRERKLPEASSLPPLLSDPAA
jgi:hypothetical protein